MDLGEEDLAAIIMVQSKKVFWHYSTEETARTLKTDLEAGLSQEEALQRLEIFGPNAIHSSHAASHIRIFLRQLQSPLIIILLAAGLITLAIAHYRDAAFILIAVVVNSVLGYYQESKADRALSELKTYLRERTKVIRGGAEKEIDARELVPGDVIRLAQGDRVPADARVIFLNDFQVDEAILTGESLPVSKSPDPSPESAALSDQTSMLFAGTLVTQGVCTAMVCRTGTETEFGKIASLVAQSEREETPLQSAIRKFSLRSSILLGILTLLIFAIGIFSGYSILEMFLTSVAIAVSAIPEGLPISLTVILAVGVERMAKRRGVVRKLLAAETLGGTTVILTDKTGTLTQAKMEFGEIISIAEDDKKLLARALANVHVLIENPEEDPESWRMSGRIMEKALVRCAAEKGVPLSEIIDKRHVLQVLPFDPAKKYSAALIKEHGKHSIVFLGAPDILISHSSLGVEEKKELLRRVDALASSGQRVLGLGSKGIADPTDFSFSQGAIVSHLLFDGLITFRDPVRPGIKRVVDQVRDAGIKTIIMTGDHKGTAMAIAEEIGLHVSERSVLDASEMRTLSESALRARLPFLSVISRVTPFDKLRIVKLFQEAGEVVAMTGDGVNDAPSIKQADIGIAMGSGTEVAQSVADLVLLDDNFETIVAAIEEGRQILKNIKKVLVYLFSNITDELILIGGSLLLAIPLPLNALQILWVNFFADSFPAIAFAFEKDEDALSHRLHGGRVMLFDPLMKFLILIIGVSTSVLLFALYVALLKVGYPEDLVRTFIFGAFGTYTLVASFSVRRLEKSIFSYRFYSNAYLTTGIGIGLVLMTAAIYIPLLQDLFDTVALPLPWLLGVVALGILNTATIEAGKWFFKRYAKG